MIKFKNNRSTSLYSASDIDQIMQAYEQGNSQEADSRLLSRHGEKLSNQTSNKNKTSIKNGQLSRRKPDETRGEPKHNSLDQIVRKTPQRGKRQIKIPRNTTIRDILTSEDSYIQQPPQRSFINRSRYEGDLENVDSDEDSKALLPKRHGKRRQGPSNR